MSQLSRRHLLIMSVMGNGLLVASDWDAVASEPVGALDTPAIRVKVPDRAFMVAIARAGGRLVAVGEHGVAIYSDDNGLSWSQAQVPVDVTLTCVAFATPMLGWAAGHFGVVLSTTDGGESWVEQLNGVQVNQLALAAAQSIQPGDVASPAFELAMKRAELFVQLGPDKPFLTLLVLSPQNIIVFGAYRMAVASKDGGKTWDDLSLEVYDRLSHDLYDAAVVGSAIYLVVETGLIFRSTDNGLTFLPVASPSAATLFGVVCARDGSIIVFGVAGNCYRSTDAGKSWQQLALATPDNLVAGHVLASGAILIGCSSGSVFVSQDNGATFQLVAGMSPLPISDFVQAANADIVFAGGAGIFVAPYSILKSLPEPRGA